MDIKEHTTPAKLEYYSFLWSEARLVIAAVALLVGGIPPIFLITPYSLNGIVYSFLTIAWIISGVTAVYLLYRWYSGKQMLFGKKETLDTVAFLVMVVSGINLGLVGIMGTNIGMTILSNKIAFIVTALVYLAAAVHLYRRWNSSGKRLF